MYTALYRKYRPATFDEMVGQEHIVKILKNQIKTGNMAHAYLFCGTRGTGKTSAARIFAKGVNCLSEGEKPCGKCENCESIQKGVFFDVIEIDAASNNRVDNIRELRESVKYPPAAGLCKVYIIDEVHMLSTGAFNALLKTLEEPPEHVIFILATTEPHKLPATILSRCLRLDFRRVPEAQIKEKLRQICEEQGIEYEESALSLIAANGDGSVRDSLSILEQCIPAGEKTLLRKDVIEIIGTAGEEAFIEITDKVIENDTAGAFLVIEKIAEDGKDIRQFIKDWILHFRNLMMSKFADRLEDIMNMSCENVARVKAQGEKIEMGFISAAIAELSATSNKARYSVQPRTLLELSVLKMSMPELSDEKEAILQRIEKLESRLDSGMFAIKNSGIEAGSGSGKSYERFAEKSAQDAVQRAAFRRNPDVGAGKARSAEISGNMKNEEKPGNGAVENGAESRLEEAVARDEKIESRVEKSGADNVSEAAKQIFDKVLASETGEAEKVSEADKGKDEDKDKDKNSAENNLWERAIEKAAAEKTALRILSDVAAEYVTEGAVVLRASSALKKNLIEQSAALLEKHLSSEAGRSVKIQEVLLAEKKKEMQSDLSKTEALLKELLGADKLTISK